MIKKTLKTLKRAPVRAFAVLLFAAVITMIICALQASNEAELRSYEELWETAPITITLTDPTGTKTDKLWPSYWVLDIFTGRQNITLMDLAALERLESEDAPESVDPHSVITSISFAEYIKDIQVKMQQLIDAVNGQKYKNPLLFGISSLASDKLLLPEHGCVITWKEGYDESVLASDEAVCLIPACMANDYDNGSSEVVLDFSGAKLVKTFIDGKIQVVLEETKYQHTFKIVGTYTGGDELSIYCPYTNVEEICSQIGQAPLIWSLSATLADNNRLEEFREKMSMCFIEPSQDANEIPQKYRVQYLRFDNFSQSEETEYYLYALDIKDNRLFDLSAVLEESIRFNRIVKIIVAALSSVSGFLVGFLMIRHRKRDIMLMRIVGESNARVFFGFALEQLICIVLGIAVGGAYYNWNPINNLAIFAVAYFVALSLALAIFMSKKLIKNIKEDE